MWQSTWVKGELEKIGCTVELVQIKTEGDVATGSLSQIGGQGVFTKRLQIALQNNEVDLAVHSLKDLPTEDAQGLSIAAIPQRETTADAFVCNQIFCSFRITHGMPSSAPAVSAAALNSCTCAAIFRSKTSAAMLTLV